MTKLLITLPIALALGCTFSGGYRDYGRDLAFHASAIDPRVGQKNVETTSKGLTVDVYKDPISEQAAEAVVDLAPVLADAIIKALAAQAGLGAVGALSEALSNPEAVPVPSPNP